MKKLLSLLTLAGILTACAPSAIFTIQGTPQAVRMRDTKTVATHIKPMSSALTQNYEQIVIDELRKPSSHFRYNPKNPDLIMHISTSRDDAKVVGRRTTADPLIWGRSYSADVTADEIVVMPSLQTKEGYVLWDGSMRGVGGVLAGPAAGRCIRVLFDYFHLNQSGEESCFRN